MSEQTAYAGPSLECRSDGFHWVIAGERVVMPPGGFGDALKFFQLLVAFAHDLAKSNRPPEQKSLAFEMLADFYGSGHLPFAKKYYELAHAHFPSRPLERKIAKVTRAMREEEKAVAAASRETKWRASTGRANRATRSARPK